MVFHRGLIRFPFPCDSIRYVLSKQGFEEFPTKRFLVMTPRSRDMGVNRAWYRRGGTYKVSQSLGLIYLPHYILVARSMNECMHACICLQTARNKQTDELTSKESQYDRHVTRSFVRSLRLSWRWGHGRDRGSKLLLAFRHAGKEGVGQSIKQQCCRHSTDCV
jgi:hypothetical protein